jgi:hypothetical protein
MTRDEAITILKAFFKSQNVDSPGLNEENLGGASIGDLQVYFEYQPDSGALKCSAHIYSFRQPPRPGILEGFKKEEVAGTDTGGGSLDYQQENSGLFLSRSYIETVSDSEFMDDMVALMAASRVWGDEVLERVASSVLHSDESKIGPP